MKKRFKGLLVTAVCAALLLAGCRGARLGSLHDIGTEPTVHDIFTVPAAPTEQDPVPEQNETTAPGPTTDKSGGGSAIGLEKYAMDDAGAYLLYEGGELHMEFGITATGSLATQGTGILLFVDGQL